MKINSKKQRIKLAYKLLLHGYIDDKLVGHFEESIQCTVPSKYRDAYEDCMAQHHSEWFDKYKYPRYGHKDDCKDCMWNKKPIKFVHV